MSSFPLRSLRGDAPEKTKAMQLRLYVDELERQGRIFNRAFARAWMATVQQQEYDLEEVWSDLQAAVFAAIIVQRILIPSRVYQRAGKTQRECQDYADRRGSELRELLEIPDNASMFSVSAVRHPLEHFDEQMDGLILADVTSVADWYVSDGLVAGSAGIGTSEYSGAGLRVFVPAGGILLFDGALLDLFALDHALIELRTVAIPEAREKLLPNTSKGKFTYGSHQAFRLNSDRWQERIDQFLAHREKAGESLGITVTMQMVPESGGSEQQ